MIDIYVIRATFAESGKMTVRDGIAVLDRKFGTNYDKKLAKAEIKEMIKEAKQYM